MDVKPFIQNVAWVDVPRRHHIEPGVNSMLIQIVDPAMEFPTPAHTFKEVHKFEFLDLEAGDDFGNEFKVTDEQAKELVRLLQHALDNRMTVIVHCVAGICRSGAVCEVGVMMGFRDTATYRQPNLMVKKKMMQALGWTYDEGNQK